MFDELNNIKEIDLSNFDFSEVTSMSYMFNYCHNLIKINFGNANTSSVKNMLALFHNCSLLSSLNVSSFDTSSVTNMEGIFYFLPSLTSIDLSNFNTKNVKTLRLLFYHCELLTSVDISNFDTSKVTSMQYSFGFCYNLKTINLGKMNTSLVKTMKCLFYYCEELESIDISSFDTSLVTSMGWMFFDCHSLKSLEFPETFNTSKVEIMYSMFAHCNSLITLNLSIFDTSKVTQMCFMFLDCNNLKYLDISHFAPLNITTLEYMFYNMYSLGYLNIDSLEINNYTITEGAFDFVPTDLKICTNKINMQNYLSSINISYNCSDICFDKNIKITNDTNKCVYSCKKAGYRHENDNICYEPCPDGTIYNEEEDICVEEKFIETTLTTFIPSENINIFSSDILNETYLSTFLIEFKDSTKNILTDINYLSSDMINESQFSKENETGTNFIAFNLTSSIIQEISSTDFPIQPIKEISLTNFQTQSIEETSQYINLTEYIHKTNFVIEGNNDELYKELIDNIIQNFAISSGEEMVIKGEDSFIFHITNTQNELDLLKGKSNSTNKFSIIDLGECGNLLKKHYNINENDSLLIIKFEKQTNISFERALQYEVYEPYNRTKLNLSICENLSIDVYIPVTLTEKLQNLCDELKDLGYDLFDINSPFYQDICTPYKSSDGTDVPLTDRVNYFYNNDETSCQSNCKFSDYLTESQYVKCDCDITSSEINTKETTKFSAKSIYESFFSVLKYSNYKVLKCAKLTFSKNSLTNNIGSIISLIYFLIYFIFFIIYVIKGISQLKANISKVILEKNEFNKSKNTKEKIEIKHFGEKEEKYINNSKK